MLLKTILVSLLTFALIHESGFAAVPILGQVIVKGHATINGVATPSRATVFLGDQVTTGTNTVAQLFLSGGNNVVLPESSTVVLNHDRSQIIVDLKQGALAVFSKNDSPAVIEASGALIKPGTNAVLEIVAQGNSLKVSSRRGSAIVETADRSLEVIEGKELDATLAPAIPQGLPGSTRTPGRNKLLTWIFITSLAAGLTGLTLGILAISRPNPTDCTFVSTTGKITCP